MALTVSSPDNSFVQFFAPGSGEAINSCIDNDSICLPVNRFPDLNFQLSIPRNSSISKLPVDSNFELILGDGECGPFLSGDGSPFSIGNLTWKQSLDGTRWIGSPVFDDENTLAAAVANGFVKPGSCFKFLLYGPANYKYSYFLPVIAFPITEIRIAYTINGIGGNIVVNLTNPGPLANIAAIVSLLNANPTTVGTWSTDGIHLIFISSISFSTSFIALSYIADEITQTHTMAVTYSTVGDPVLLGCSNCFYYTPDICFLTLVKYRDSENSMSFNYNNDTGSGNTLASFYNLIRLPFYIDSPQIITDKTTYRKSDGNYKKLSSIMQKEYTGKVDWLDEGLHTKLSIALEHEDLQFFNDSTGEWLPVIADASNEYQIGWQNNDGNGTNDGIVINTAPATFKVKLSPFANFNSNCS